MSFAPLNQWAMQYSVKRQGKFGEYTDKIVLPIVGVTVDPEGTDGVALVLAPNGTVKTVRDAVPDADEWQVIDATPDPMSSD